MTEFRHPILEALGVPKIKLPSKKLVLFWSLSGCVLGAYYYDRFERKKVRDYWVNRVEYLANQPIKPLEKLPKFKVLIAPPPNDFLNESLQHFRNFVKPILTAAAVDHELVVEERQGHIRTLISEDIRKFRRGESGNVNYLGTIIIGRGAYREYINGLQEGWLGPVNTPLNVQKVIDKERKLEEERIAKRRRDNARSSEGLDPYLYEDETQYHEDKKARLNRKYKVVPNYLTAPGELDLKNLGNFEIDPISVFKLPHLLGILMTPFRAYRWLNQRYLAEELGAQAVGVVLNNVRKFNLPADLDLAVSDEEDWPQKFKSRGESEWLKPLELNEEIADKMTVFVSAERK